MVKNEAKENKTKLMASASCFFIFQFFEKTFAFLIRTQPSSGRCKKP